MECSLLHPLVGCSVGEGKFNVNGSSFQRANLGAFMEYLVETAFPPLSPCIRCLGRGALADNALRILDPDGKATLFIRTTNGGNVCML